jgi:HK97 family phage prohead protease
MKNKRKQEVRTLPALELRIAPAVADGTRTLTGMAIVYGQRSQNLGGFVEVVSPAALTDTLSTGKNVLLLNNHNSSQPLASTASGTLSLKTDSRGVSFTAKLDTRLSYANDLALSIEAGVTSGMSFGFRTLDDSYANDSGVLVRTLNQIELFELSATVNPAYLQTVVDVRSCPKESRSLMDSDDEDECTCLRDEDDNLLDPDNCDCPDEVQEDRSAWAEMTLLRLEVAKRR